MNHVPDTKQQIVRFARQLIQTRSYLGFSFQDIADQVGIRKPSLYHHFASKEALGIEVLRQTHGAFERWVAKTPPSPQGKLNAYFDMYRHGLNPGHGMCPAGAMTPGWDCIEEGLKEAARALREVQLAWLADVVLALHRKRRIACEHWASYIFSSAQGAMVSARMSGRSEDFDIVADIAQRTVLTLGEPTA
ncbi:MAG TPA: TetR/AcrR family transcriptional regulator [Steroidobacteraceae bacterium]